MKLYLRAIIFFFFIKPCFSQDTVIFPFSALQQNHFISDSLYLSTEGPKIGQNSLTLVFTGDIMGHDGQIAGAFDGRKNSYNYEPTFRYVKDYLTAADIAIGNLEVTLAGPPYMGYPQFSSPDALVVEAKKAGYDILVTANNHALDRGGEGVERTLSVLDSLGFLRAGTYKDSVDRIRNCPLIFEKNHIRIALLNYTYGTNELVVKPPLTVNRIDTLQIIKDLNLAHSVNPDCIIVFIHWGKEYERTENSMQVKQAQFLFNNGVDVIIGSHPHVVQPLKYISISSGTGIKNCPVVYSLGNFVSNQRNQYVDGGIVAELSLKKDGAQTHVESLKYLPYWVWREDKGMKSTFYVLPVSKYELDTSRFNLLPGDVYRLKRFAKDVRLHMGTAEESVFYKSK